MAVMVLGQNPSLERESAGIRSEADKVGGIEHHAFLRSQLLLDHIAEDATAAIVEELQRPCHFFPNRNRDDGRDDELRVGVLQGSAGGSADILKQHAVHEPGILL